MNLKMCSGNPKSQRMRVSIPGSTLSKADLMSRKTAAVKELLQEEEYIFDVKIIKLSKQDLRFQKQN